MDVLLPQSLATVVEYYPPRRPTSATLRVLSPSGSSLAAPTATVDPLVRTISAVTDAETITAIGTTIAAGSNGAALPQATISVAATTIFASAGSLTITTSAGSETVTYTGKTSTTFTGCAGGTGTMSTGGAVVQGTLTPGRYAWWVSADGQESRTLISRVDSTTIKLEWPVAQPLAEVGDTLNGARVTATVPTTATGTRGENYALEWTTTHADGTVMVERQCAHVVAAQSRPAVDVGLAKACMVASWPGYADQRTFGYFLTLAERASERLWKRIRRTGRYPHLLWQAGDFEAAGRIAVDYELAVDKLIPNGNMDAEAYKEGLVKELDREIEDVISSRGYDADASISIDETEVRNINAIALRRW